MERKENLSEFRGLFGSDPRRQRRGEETKIPSNRRPQIVKI